MWKANKTAWIIASQIENWLSCYFRAEVKTKAYFFHDKRILFHVPLIVDISFTIVGNTFVINLSITKC